MGMAVPLQGSQATCTAASVLSAALGFLAWSMAAAATSASSTPTALPSSLWALPLLPFLPLLLPRLVKGFSKDLARLVQVALGNTLVLVGGNTSLLRTSAAHD